MTEAESVVQFILMFASHPYLNKSTAARSIPSIGAILIFPLVHHMLTATALVSRRLKPVELEDE